MSLLSPGTEAGYAEKAEAEIEEEAICQDDETGKFRGSTDRQRGNKLVPKGNSLCYWDPQPIHRPVIDPEFQDLAWPQRSVEVVLYWFGRIEHWLSPGGWLRAWLRLNIWIAVFLSISAATVVPAMAAVMTGLTGWTGQVSVLSDDIARIVHSLPPIVMTIGVIFLVVHLVRRYRNRSRQHHRRHGHSSAHHTGYSGPYDGFDEFQ